MQIFGGSWLLIQFGRDNIFKEDLVLNFFLSFKVAQPMPLSARPIIFGFPCKDLLVADLAVHLI